MSKRIPFNIKYRPQIESGEYKVETRDGKHVRILCYDANNIVPIVALVTFNDGSEGACHYYSDGAMYCEETPLDLFIVIPEKELTEFERRLVKFYNDRDSITCDKDGVFNRHEVYELLHSTASELLSLAREQFIKDGYVIEKKAFHDAVKKVDPKVMKEVSEKWDAMKEALRLEYEKGRADALKDFEAQCQSSVDNTHGLTYELGFKAGKKAGYEVGKYDTLKDLPIWKRIRDIGDLAFVENDIKLDKVIICPDKEGRMYYIYRTDLFEKLPKDD